MTMLFTIACAARLVVRLVAHHHQKVAAALSCKMGRTDRRCLPTASWKTSGSPSRSAAYLPLISHQNMPAPLGKVAFHRLLGCRTGSACLAIALDYCSVTKGRWKG